MLNMKNKYYIEKKKQILKKWEKTPYCKDMSSQIALQPNAIPHKNAK